MVRLISKIALTCVFVALSSAIYAQKESSDVRHGNKAYDKEKYVDAEVDYRKGLEQNNKSFSAAFNLGDALYRQEKFTDAAEQFQRAATLAGSNKERLAASYHNLGNSFLQAGDYAKSVEAYKQALRNNPKDDETRYNLAYAQQMLKQQEQQNQNQNQDQDKKDEQKQDKQQQQNQNQQDQQQNQDKQQQEQQQQSQSNMSREQAEQILQALEQDERDTQEKVKEQQMQQTKRYRVDKDW